MDGLGVVRDGIRSWTMLLLCGSCARCGSRKSTDRLLLFVACAGTVHYPEHLRLVAYGVWCPCCVVMMSGEDVVRPSLTSSGVGGTVVDEQDSEDVFCPFEGFVEVV